MGKHSIEKEKPKVNKLKIFIFIIIIIAIIGVIVYLNTGNDSNATATGGLRSIISSNKDSNNQTESEEVSNSGEETSSEEGQGESSSESSSTPIYEGLTKVDDPEIETQAEEIVEKLFTALKEGNKEEASKYTDYDLLISTLDEMILEDNTTSVESMLFFDLSWKISSVDYYTDIIVINAEVTNKDYKTIFTNWLSEIADLKAQETEITNDVMLELLEKCMQENGSETRTVSKEIYLAYSDEEWKVAVTNDLRNLVYPGIEDIANSLN